jgi:hypothetical protein
MRSKNVGMFEDIRPDIITNIPNTEFATEIENPTCSIKEQNAIPKLSPVATRQKTAYTALQ